MLSKLCLCSHYKKEELNLERFNSFSVKEYSKEKVSFEKIKSLITEQDFIENFVGCILNCYIIYNENVSFLILYKKLQGLFSNDISFIMKSTIINSDEISATKLNISEITPAILLAMCQNEVVILPDFTGFSYNNIDKDNNNIMQEYFIKDSYNNYAINCLKTALTFLKDKNISLRGRINSIGYSEGGYIAYNFANYLSMNGYIVNNLLCGAFPSKFTLEMFDSVENKNYILLMIISWFLKYIAKFEIFVRDYLKDKTLSQLLYNKFVLGITIKSKKLETIDDINEILYLDKLLQDFGKQLTFQMNHNSCRSLYYKNIRKIRIYKNNKDELINSNYKNLTKKSNIKTFDLSNSHKTGAYMFYTITLFQ